MPNQHIEQALKEQAVDLELQALHQQVNHLQDTVNELKEERNSFLKWGVLSLGAAVVGMGMYVWNIFAHGLSK